MLMRIEITREDRGWKGTCGRIGERYIVFSRPKPPPYGEGQHAQFGRDIITHHRDDFRRIPMGFAGLVEIVRLAPKAWRDRRLSRSIRAALGAPK